jgi:hypothetical protein
VKERVYPSSGGWGNLSDTSENVRRNESGSFSVLAVVVVVAGQVMVLLSSVGVILTGEVENRKSSSS